MGCGNAPCVHRTSGTQDKPQGILTLVEALKAMDMLEGEVAEVPAEGTLAPDSYEISEGATRDSVLERMKATQSARLAAAWEAREPDLPLEKVHQFRKRSRQRRPGLFNTRDAASFSEPAHQRPAVFKRQLDLRASPRASRQGDDNIG